MCFAFLLVPFFMANGQANWCDCELCDSLAAEECYSDVAQRARTAAEADGVRDELTNSGRAAGGGGAAAEADRALTVSDYSEQH